MKRDFITEYDVTAKEISEIFALTSKLKKKRNASKALKGKTIGLIFQKPSLRTRVSFEVGIHQLGGNCIYLGPDEINLGKRETTHDVAQTLSRYLDGIVARVFSHQSVVDLAKYSAVPVINGLCDLYHPCQALTDVYSVLEKFGTFKKKTLAYIGDGNNVCHSLMLVCAKMGLSMTIATPVNYEPNEEILATAQELAKKTGVTISVGRDPKEAVKSAHVIYSDVWVSMGQEEETQKRLKDFQGFQINSDLTSWADKKYIFMHCLPAHRGEEVSADVIDSKHSIVFDQAENRLHVQKAILIFLLGRKVTKSQSHKKNKGKS
jgi:ornithine carbamoyltransferase